MIAKWYQNILYLESIFICFGQPIFCLFVLSNTIFSQMERNYFAFESFKEQYHSGDFEMIYNRFSTAVKRALSVANAIQFFTGFQVHVRKNYGV